MAKKPESRLQRRIRDRLEKEVGGWWFKVHGSMFQVAGVPDLVGCVNGMFFALEVKTEDGDTSEIQDETIRRIKLEGGGATVVVTPKEAVAFVKEHLRKAGRLSEARGPVRARHPDGGSDLRTRNRKDVDRHWRRRSTR
jgi:Holliday junction resolvase